MAKVSAQVKMTFEMLEGMDPDTIKALVTDRLARELASQIVDEFMNIENNIEFQTATFSVSLEVSHHKDADDQILELIRADPHRNKVAAIKMTRNLYGYDLKSAKDYVESLTERMAVT